MIDISALNMNNLHSNIPRNNSKKSFVDKIIKANNYSKKTLSRSEIEELILKDLPEHQTKKVKLNLKKISNVPEVLNREVRLNVNEGINRVIITIIDKETNKVIKEIPCKELQNLARHLDDIVGILYDKKV